MNDAIGLHSALMQQQHQRPKFLNLFQIRLPVTGITSILHRVSGVLLFLAIPTLIYMLNISLEGQVEFDHIAHWAQQPLMKFVMTLLAWALWHHLLAGIRYLLADIAIGLSLAPARRSAWLVNIFSIAGAFLIIGMVWL
jgi:succinate dehydrogenase / fumarate reductase cytochrome b subunit